MLKIAILEVCPDARKKYSKALADSGYKVVYTAADGPDARCKNRTAPAQMLVILHPGMIIVDDNAFAENFWEEHPETCIVYCSDYMKGVARDSEAKYTCEMPEPSELVEMVKRIELDMSTDAPHQEIDPYTYEYNYKRLVQVIRDRYGDGLAEDIINRM